MIDAATLRRLAAKHPPPQEWFDDETDPFQEVTVKVRIVKNRDCKICEVYLPRLDEIGFLYEIYDAEEPGREQQLDEWKIDEMPVVQVVDDAGAVLYQFPPGTIAARAIKYKMRQLERGK